MKYAINVPNFGEYHHPEKGAETLAPWIDAGATWWSENINTWRGSGEERRERVFAGPPRT